MSDEEESSTSDGLRYLRSVFLNKHPEKKEEEVKDESTIEKIDETKDEMNTDESIDESQPEEFISFSDLISKTLELIPPESTVSTLPSINKSIEVNKTTVPQKKNALGALFNDMIDRWDEVILPYSPLSLSIYNELLIISVKGKQSKWLPINLLSHSKSIWSTSKWKADTLFSNGSFLIRCESSFPYLLTSDLSPSTIDWIKLNTSKIKSISMNSRDVWMIEEDGIVRLSMGLPNDCIEHVLECETSLSCISVKDDAAWAITDNGTLMVRVGFTKNRRFGEDWVEITPEDPSTPLVSLYLWNDSAFILDDTYTLWRADSVNEYTPFGRFFYRIGTPLDSLSFASIPSTPLLSISSRGIFISIGKRLFYSSSPLSSHRFIPQLSSSLSSLDNFSLISAGAHSIDYDSNGVLLTLSSTGELFSFRPLISSYLHPFIYSSYMNNIDKISLMASSSNRYIFIDLTGRGFCMDNGKYHVLTVPHEVISISISEVSVWIVTRGRRIFYSNQFPPNEWKEIEGQEAEKISISSNGRYVWILNDGRGYVRKGINDKNMIGDDWIEMIDPTILSSISVSNSIVFALSIEGRLLRLRGLSALNVRGDRWIVISPSHFFSSLSIDSSSSLWLITREGQLIKHEISIFHYS